MKLVALDWLVAQAEGIEVSLVEPAYGLGWRLMLPCGSAYSPSRNWSQGGPLVDKRCISVKSYRFPKERYLADFYFGGRVYFGEGPTALEAICRAVADEVGGDVHVPEQLQG